MTKPKPYWLAPWCAALLAVTPQSKAASRDPTVFLQKNCVECHDADTKKGGLDLTSLKPDFKSPDTFATWVMVHDRVSAGEMPPPKKKVRPSASELSSFTNRLSSSLLAADRARITTEGRATQRRLNGYEYEDTLRDLLSLPRLEVKSFLPDDTESYGFNKIGDALDVSHVQMARYLSAAEFALRQALAPQVARPTTKTNRYYTWQEREFFGKIKLDGPLNRRTFPLVGLELQRDLMGTNAPARAPVTTDPERRSKEAMALVVSSYEPTEIRFGGFRTPVSGRYKLRFSAYTVWMGPKYTEVTTGHRPEPVCIYAEVPPTSLRKLGDFDVNPEPTIVEMEVNLLAGETIRPDAARFFRSRPPDHKNPLATPEGMPSVAFQWMEVEGPIVEQWPPASHQLLFGELPIKDRAASNVGGRRIPAGVEVISENQDRDAEKLLRAFMQKVYRSPVRDAEVQRFLALIRTARNTGLSFTDSMIAGYTGVLSSPAFLYFNEKPGRLDDLALAERLSYFLWNTRPDDELRRLAEQKELHRPAVLRKQTERLLNDPKFRRFVDDFLDYWLDLRLIAGPSPEEELYPEYQLDDLLNESMIGETQLFFNELLQRNLGVANLVSSDFTILNERLATHYDIPGISGVALRTVKLPANSVRGGLLTQASVLKVTANGTTTSPVKRGAWIMTRLLGRPPPPPPAAVAAVEPDIRGATTIRDQLAKHRTQEACAACHKNIDPAGFALESFDVMGGWRDRYRAIGEGEKIKGIGHNGLNFHYSLALNVDPTGELPDGRKFADVRELKELLLKDQEQLARNLLQQLTIYATGAPIQFSDRPVITKLVANAKSSSYGVRTLIHELIQSDLFLNK